MKLVLSGVLLALVAAASAKNFGAIKIKGVDQQIYVVGPDWTSDFIVMNGEDGFTLNGGGRIYFANNIDLSNVGCHCNAAGYFIGMPGAGPGEGGDWYCDANFVGGQWCPEYDCLESNKYTVAGTLHTCNGSPGNWNDCDRGGCQENAFRVDQNMFCPESRCTIDTNKPFLISHSQSTGYANIWMSQDGKEASFNVCGDGGYNSNMAQSYNGMVFSASLWGGNGINMDWLDGMTGCGGECNIGGSSVTFSGFELW